jgi:dTDP-4-amino-4,6-dideoxygalactose transaminase
LNIPLLDLKAQYKSIKEEIIAATMEVYQSQRFILGPKVEALESEIAAYTQAKYAVGVSSGTDALLISLMSANICPGDLVVTSPYTFFSTAGSIARLGATPVFVDIDTHTYCHSKVFQCSNYRGCSSGYWSGIRIERWIV